MNMAKSRVLIVDDDAALLQALPQAIALRLPEVAVDTAKSALEALKCAKACEYDAIVSDIKMPGMDGLALIEHLHKLYPDIPTILITGHGERELAIQALRVGAYDFIQKPIDRDYFIAALQRAMQKHHMSKQIAQQQQELEQYLASLEQTVAERTHELVEANAAKDVFISMASHELKTPLTTLKGMAQMLLKRVERGYDIELRNVQLLENAVHRMEVLVDDLLNTSLLETGMFALHRQQHDVVQCCRDLKAEYGNEMGELLILDIVTPKLICNIDQERIGQVLLNLLSNARKYSPANSPVTIRVESRDTEAVISVIDRGVGIDARHLNRIFERFYRAPGIDVQSGANSGVGLGLYITQKIIERHQGRIIVSSTPGQGSTFCVHLPLAAEKLHSDKKKHNSVQVKE